MSDLEEVLPDFDPTPYRHLLFSLQKKDVTVAELITQDPIDLVKKCPLPLRDLRVMIPEIVKALRAEGINQSAGQRHGSEEEAKAVKTSLVKQLVVRTLDPVLDECLGGGFYTGHISEIVGESAVGKTQFVLGLLLSCQLPVPVGLGKNAIYLSTEAALNTNRLLQMLDTNENFQTVPEDGRPSLDRIHTMVINDLEAQEHIIQYQIPIAVKRFNVGLIVLDSVAANFRAESETKTARGLADRATDLMKLGTMLRRIAVYHNIAIVVTNQVSDRFDDAKMIQDKIRSSSPLRSSSPASQKLMPPPPAPSRTPTVRNDILSLDHQQRFFTGWGDSSMYMFEPLKTPALGLAWANQISARVVLKMESERMSQHPQDYLGGNIWKDKKKRRFLGVVFAPWVAPTVKPVEYEIQMQGAISIIETTNLKADLKEDNALLDPTLWVDVAADADEEFP